MPGRKKPEFPLTPSLENFKYEVAEEIAINNKKHQGLLGAKTEQSQNKSE